MMYLSILLMKVWLFQGGVIINNNVMNIPLNILFAHKCTFVLRIQIEVRFLYHWIQINSELVAGLNNCPECLHKYTFTSNISFLFLHTLAEILYFYLFF